MRPDGRGHYEVVADTVHLTRTSTMSREVLNVTLASNVAMATDSTSFARSSERLDDRNPILVSNGIAPYDAAPGDTELGDDNVYGAAIRAERIQSVSVGQPVQAQKDRRPGAYRITPGGNAQDGDSSDDDAQTVVSAQLTRPASPGLPPPLPDNPMAPDRTTPEAILLEATLVADSAGPDLSVRDVSLVVEATPIRKRQQVLTISAIVIVSSTVVALAVGVPLGLRNTPNAIRNNNSPSPSIEPTRSGAPTFTPSPAAPWTSAAPTTLSTVFPSVSQSTLPGETFDRRRFQQPFELEANNTAAAFLTDKQSLDVGQLFTSYTSRFSPVDDDLQKTSSLCIVNSQSITENSTIFINALDYTCQYKSTSLNVTGYTEFFLTYVNSNLTGVTDDLVSMGLPVLRSDEAKFVTIITVSPTIRPSFSPTQGFSLPPTPPLSSVEPSGGLSEPAMFGIIAISAVMLIMLPTMYYVTLRRQFRRPRRGTPPLSSNVAMAAVSAAPQSRL